MDFTGKIVVVTGSGAGKKAGIGQSAAELFVENHADTVVITDVNPDNLAAAEKLLENRGSRILSYLCDVSDEERVNEVMADVTDKCGKIDILVNNAGIYDTWIPFAQSDSKEWRKKFDINVLGTMYCTRAVLPGMIERQYGRIVNVASVAGVYGIAKFVDYSATKGAIIAFTKALAKEVTASGVTVNSVSPGNINPDPSASPHLSYMNRSGSPRECAQMIVFLASDEASYVSGQDHQVDGCRRGM